MLNYQSVFVRHGWLLEDKGFDLGLGGYVFDCSGESIENMKFLIESLSKANVSFEWNEPSLFLFGTPICEEEWINVIDFSYRGRTEMVGEYKENQQPEIRMLDTYIAGLVRQLNRLGFKTICSCDGHGRRSASVNIVENPFTEELIGLLFILGVKKVNYYKTSHHYRIHLRMERMELLDLAEKLNQVDVNWIGKGKAIIEKQLFINLLEELLNIPGKSEDESTVRNYVMKELKPYVDNIMVDHYGNILAEKTYGRNGGPTILLNAHLDTVEEIHHDRVILKDGKIWSGSDGILGADDRAGVAVVLKLAQYLYTQSIFNGKVKFIFTVEEEIGLLGAKNVDEHFLWGIDAAFVIDRRGTSDIVTHNWSMKFCSEEFGGFVEEMAKQSNLVGWKCTRGGSSDTRIWAEHGIQSVNLSAGYWNEHTERECLDVDASFNVTTLLKKVFERSNEMRRVFLNRDNRGRVKGKIRVVNK